MYYTDDYLHEQFVALVLTELRLRHVPIDRRAFADFMDSMKPLVCVEDGPQRWADAFLEAQADAGASAA